MRIASGHLMAAASDVFAEEPTPADNPLLRQLEYALQDINRFLAGQRPERLINPEILERRTV